MELFSLQYYANKRKSYKLCTPGSTKKSANLRMLNPLMLFITFLEKGLTDIKTDVLFCFSVIDNSFRHLLVQRNIDVYNCCRDCHNEEH